MNMLLEPESISELNKLGQDMNFDDIPLIPKSEYRKLTSKEHIERANKHLNNALVSMEGVSKCSDTPVEVKQKIKKIIEVFSMDKDEFDRIIKQYYE